MVFNSGVFLVFFLVLYPLYAVLPFRAQNSLLLIASLFFYGYWDPRFLGLLVATILVDYVAARSIDTHKRAGRPRAALHWLRFAVGCNLLVLGFFKYFGFFTESLAALLESLGFEVHLPTLHVVLPLGISFYTFQSMSYTIDVHRGPRGRPDASTTSRSSSRSFRSSWPARSNARAHCSRRSSARAR